MLLAARETEQRRQIVDAAGIDRAKLSEQGQCILNWLAEWDDWTTGGIVELLQAARAAARHETPQVPRPMTAVTMDDDFPTAADRQAAAQGAYRASVANGHPLTGAELGRCSTAPTAGAATRSARPKPTTTGPTARAACR